VSHGPQARAARPGYFAGRDGVLRSPLVGIMTELFRYAAFISYSSKDEAFARRLHRALERFRVPASLGTFDLIGGGRKNRIYPVFRDREELSAGGLQDRIEAALRASATLIVVCSPDAAASPWVQKEIDFFITQGRRDKIFGIVAADAPLADASGADATLSAFPPALLAPSEKIAGDARKGKDGFRNAFLKVAAGLIDVTPGQLIDRDRRRRRDQGRLAVAALSLAIMAIAGAAAAVDARNWRTRLSTVAETMTARRQVDHALTFAVAAEPPRGALLTGRSDRADASLASVAAMRILADVDHSAEFTGDGAMMVAVRDERRVLVNIADGAAADLGTLRFFKVVGERLYTQGEDRLVRIWEAPTAASGVPIPGLGPVDNVRVSTDGRFLSATGAGLRGVLVDLRTQAITDLGPLRYPSYMSDNERTLIAPAENGDIVAYTLDQPIRRIDLGALMPAPSRPWRSDDAMYTDLSRDGRFMITQTYGWRGVIYDLARGGERIDVGDWTEMGHLGSRRSLFFTAPDASGIVAIGRDGRLRYADVRRRRVHVIGNPDWLRAHPTEDLQFLLTHGDDQRLTLFDFRNGFERTELGEINNPRWIGVVGSTHLVLAQDQQERTLLLDLDHGGARTDLGRLADLQQLQNGAILLGRDSDDKWRLIDLRAGGRRIEVGALPGVRAFDISDEGTLVVVTAEGRGVLIDLESGARTDLGQLGSDGVRLAPGGGALLVSNFSNGGARLFDLSRLPWQGDPPRGRRLWRAACSANADHIEPLADASLVDLQEAGVQDAVRGRPRNPCDWRGLLAVFPDAERGDGWFEGLRQWSRLVRVRHFRARDWACEETTSRANAETRAARAEKCERAARRAAR